MIDSVKVGLSRLRKKLQQPAQEGNGADLDSENPAHATLCERCTNIPMSPEDLHKMAMRWRGHGSSGLGPKHDTCGLLRLYVIKDLFPEDCGLCRFLWET
jgi:hypothetical protein